MDLPGNITAVMQGLSARIENDANIYYRLII